MPDLVSLDDLDLAALLCSRVCHDLISPVGAIVNGLEVLEDDADEQMRDVAMDLIRKSAEQASDSLQFARLAFGAAGSAGATLEVGELERVARAHAESERLTMEWEIATPSVRRDAGRLLLNLVLTALQALPRGGRIAVSVEGSEEAPSYRFLCSGYGARVPPELPALMRGEAADAPLDARSVQPYYAGRLAGAAGLKVSIAETAGDVEIRAHP